MIVRLRPHSCPHCGFHAWCHPAGESGVYHRN
jgi:hypothetical protein